MAGTAFVSYYLHTSGCYYVRLSLLKCSRFRLVSSLLVRFGCGDGTETQLRQNRLPGFAHLLAVSCVARKRLRCET